MAPIIALAVLAFVVEHILIYYIGRADERAEQDRRDTET